MGADGKLRKAYTDDEKKIEIAKCDELLHETQSPFRKVPGEIEKTMKDIAGVLKDQFPSVFDLIERIGKVEQESQRGESPIFSEGVAVLTERKNGKAALRDAMGRNMTDVGTGERLRGAIQTAIQQIEDETVNNRAVRDAIGNDEDPTVMIIDLNLKEEKIIREELQVAVDHTFQEAGGNKNDNLLTRKKELEEGLDRLSAEIADLDVAIRRQSTTDQQKKEVVEKAVSLRRLLKELQQPLNTLNLIIKSVQGVRGKIGQLQTEMKRLSEKSQVLTLPEGALEELARELNAMHQQLCDDIIAFYRQSLQKLYKTLYVLGTRDKNVREDDMNEKNKTLIELLPDILKDNLFPFENELKKLKQMHITPDDLKNNEQMAIDAFFQANKTEGGVVTDLTIPSLFRILREKKFQEIKDQIVMGDSNRTTVALNVVLSTVTGKGQKERDAEIKLKTLTDKFRTFIQSKKQTELLMEDTIGKIGTKDETLALQKEYQSIENQIINAAVIPLLSALLTPPQVKILQEFQNGKGKMRIKIALKDKEFIFSSGEGSGNHQVNAQDPSRAVLEGDQSLLALISSLLDALQKGDLDWKVEVSEINS